MRTNIEIDDELLNAAMRLGNKPTKKATVEEALQEYIALFKRKKILKLRGKATWKGNLQQMRKA